MAERERTLHSQAVVALKGLSRGIMFVTRGGIANDNTTKTQVSFAASALDVISTIEYTVYGTTETYKATLVTNSLPATFTVASEAIDPESGLVGPVVLA